MLSKRSIKLKPRRTSESMSTTIPSENYSKGIESMTWTNQSFMVYTYQSQQSTLTFSEKNWDIWNTKYPPFHPKFNLFFFNLGDFFLAMLCKRPLFHHLSGTTFQLPFHGPRSGPRKCWAQRKRWLRFWNIWRFLVSMSKFIGWWVY